MKSHLAVLVLATLCVAGTASQAAETCHSFATERGEFRHCVSSARPSAAGKKFGPQMLSGMEDGAWCAAGDADARPAITQHIKPRSLIQTIAVTNGYAKSDATFRDHGRAKRVLIETDRGFKNTITLRDQREHQTIKIPKSRIGWVKMTILETYPGRTSPHVCVSEFLGAVEEFMN